MKLTRYEKKDDISKIYIVTKEYIKFRKPPKMTERQLENLNKRHNKKNKGVII